MTREIKFRAFSFTNKVMYDRVLVGNTLTDSPCSLIYTVEYGWIHPHNIGLSNWEKWVNFDNACGIIMQYTGLKDKNGKEIYEGDIVEEPIFGMFQIKWDKEHLCFCLAMLKSNISTILAITTRMKVIGNIYENPELLEENHDKTNN